MLELKEVSIEVTNACSQKCIHCSSQSGKLMNNELALDEITSIIDQSKDLGTNILTLSGGEPLLRPDVFDIIKYAKNKNFEIRLQTGGTYKNKDITISLPNYLLENLVSLYTNKDSIIFNVQGIKETHNKITGVNGGYDLVLESINKTVNNNLKTVVHTVPNKLNYWQIPELENILAEKGVYYWHFLRLVPQGRALLNSQLNLNKNEFKKLQKIFSQLGSKSESDSKKQMQVILGHNINKRYWDCNSEIKSCNLGIDKILIRPNGKISFCAALKYTDSANIRTQSLRDIWLYNSEIIKFREFLDQGYKSIKGKCFSCDILDLCKGGCLAQRLYSYKDNLFQGPDPLCYRKIKNKI